MYSELIATTGVDRFSPWKGVFLAVVLSILRVLITPSVYSNFYVRWVSVDTLVSSIDKSNYIPK